MQKINCIEPVVMNLLPCPAHKLHPFPKPMLRTILRTCSGSGTSQLLMATLRTHLLTHVENEFIYLTMVSVLVSEMIRLDSPVSRRSNMVRLRQHTTPVEGSITAEGSDSVALSLE